MACHTALRTASSASSGSHPTVHHQAPAEKEMTARVNTRTYGHDGTPVWKWIGVAVVAAVVAAVAAFP
jgi:anti-sigma-K factor RskA